MNARSYAQAAASKKSASVQPKRQSQYEDEPDTYIVRGPGATTPLEGASEHGYTGTVAGLRARNNHSRTAAGGDYALDSSVVSTDPYFQQYDDAMRGELKGGRKTKIKPLLHGGAKAMLCLEYYSSTDGDTQASSGVPSSGTNTMSRGKEMVSGVHRVQDIENNSGVAAKHQGASNSVPRDVLDIQFGWDDEEEENNLAQSGMSQSTAETVGRQPPYAHVTEADAVQDVDGMFENEVCTCVPLMYALQDWCMLRHGKGPLELSTTVPVLFAHLRRKLNCSSDVPVCPEHGFPDLSAQSQCDQCADEYTYVNSPLAAAALQTPQSKESASQVPVSQAPLDKRSRMEITKANEAMEGMIKAIQVALREAEEEDRQLDGTVRWMDAMKEDTERALESHVQQLLNYINHRRQVVLDNFARSHNSYVIQVERDKQQVAGFAGSLTGLQRGIEQKLTEMKTAGVSAAKTVPQLQEQFYAFMATKPQTMAKIRPWYSYEVKPVTNEEIASIVGDVRITENNAPETMPSQPSPSGIGGHPGTEFPKTFPASSAGQTDLSFMQPAASMENLDPYYSYMDGGASAASLGQKEKLSQVMASASSVASETRCASSTRTSLQNQQKTTKMRPEIQKTRPDVQKARPGVQSQTPAPTVQPANDTAVRMQPTVRTLAVKPNCSPHILRLPGPTPVAIAPSDNGGVWMVYGTRNPNLQLMSGTKKLLNNIRIGGNAVAVAVLKSEQVLLACHSPKVHLRLVKGGVPQHVMDLPATPVSLSVGKSGLVVGGHTTLCWVTLPDWKAQWIVPAKNSPLQKVCATAVTFFRGKELVCAADRVGEAVHFYLKNDDKTFTPLRPYCGPPQGADGETAGQFVPISVTAHPKGIVAILDDVSQSVYVLNVEQSQEAVSIIPGQSLYRNGIPSAIALGWMHGSDDHLKLWAIAEDDFPFVSHTPVRFQ